MNSVQQNIVFANNVSPANRAAVEAYINGFKERDIPAILSVSHFSHLTGVIEKELYGISNSKSAFYRNFKLKKKNGGFRKISAPLPTLLYVQQWILKNILEKIEIHPTAKAYRKGFSIKENAKFHRAQKFLFKSDVSDFFGSIPEYWVFSFFIKIGYINSVAALLAKACCKDGSLPQGGATSGYLSNIYLSEFDEEAFSFCRQKSLRYTRYADDIAISGKEMDYNEVKAFIYSGLKKLNLKINSAKTRIYKPHNRQKVTGVVVNDKLSPGREFLRDLRKDIYYINKFGIYGHVRKIESKSAYSCLNNLIGRISHATHLLSDNKKLESERKKLIKIQNIL